MSRSNRRLLRRLWLLRDTALAKAWLVETQQAQQVGRLLLWRLLRPKPSAVFGRGRVCRRHIRRQDMRRMVRRRPTGSRREDGRRNGGLLVVRVLLLAGGWALLIATRSAAAAVKPLKKLLQISHGESDLGDLFARQQGGK